MIYKSYLVPNDVMTDELFLRHLFSATLLEALGLKDESGVIYELINYRCSSYLGYSCFFRFFTNSELGHWDLMIDGMINVSPPLHPETGYPICSRWSVPSSSRPPPTSS